MTASAPSSPRPGRAALAGRPVGALLVLLLVALLTALPCAGQASAVPADRSAPVPAAPTTPVGGPTADGPDGAPPHHAGPRTDRSRADGRHAEGPRHRTLCSADGEPPRRDNGCSGHPYCGQDAQLPNPPPQPQPAVTPGTELPEALPRVVPTGLLDGPHPAPDLHELQVHRS
ncbi:hypothetical protein ACF9IK_26930 [Kitasatospora hibisci]|uniref:hypothetical protein n=1 Tax=Kitasatospora hibisci TaxID=3369522 RepID=UPI0037552152